MQKSSKKKTTSHLYSEKREGEYSSYVSGKGRRGGELTSKKRVWRSFTRKRGRGKGEVLVEGGGRGKKVVKGGRAFFFHWWGKKKKGG